MSDIFDSIQNRLNKIEKIMDLTPAEIKILTEPKKINQTSLEIEGEKIPAWRIVFNDALGPGKGGIRFHPDASESEVKSLAFWMMLKNSLAGLPYGGAKGGVKFNPKGKSKKYLEKVSRAYIEAFGDQLGEDKDIPAPDVYTNPEIMGWMLDQFEKKVGHHEPGMITGKPVVLGGSTVRGDATARGGQIIFDKLVSDYKLNKDEITIAVQGFGNAGAHLARMLFHEDYKIVAVSDSRGGIYNAGGLDVTHVLKTKEETGEVQNYEDGKKISNAELLGLKVDVLILAAMENQITKANAGQTKAKYILELANGPIDSEADEILWKNGHVVIPDILANSGGVIASYFEWVQNKTGGIFDNEFLEARLQSMLEASWHALFLAAKRNDGKYSLRTEAYMIAIERVLKAEKARGNL